MHYLDETHILLFLVQLSIILILTRGLGELFRKWNQPTLTAELLVGIMLGPTILGRFFPQVMNSIFPADPIQQNMLETVAWIGVLFLLLDTGLEIDFSVAWRQRGNALVISLSDIAIPIIIAFIPAYFLPDSYLADPDRRIIFSLFLAVVMTISALPVSSRVLHDLKLLKTDIGFLIMSALTVNDIIGWVLFTIIIGIFTQSGIDIPHIFVMMAVTIGFAVVALAFGRKMSTNVLRFFNKVKLPEPGTSFTFACILALVFGAITQGIGIHALFGFLIAGIVIGEAKNLRAEARATISQMVHALFVPVFFANIGLKLDFIADFDILLISLITVIGIFGRYIGAWIGTSLTKVERINRNIIAIAHTPGGMMEIVVALLALEMGLILPKVFVAIAFSAVFSSVILGPWIRFAMNRRKKIPFMEYISNAYTTALRSSTVSGAIKELVSAVARTDMQDAVMCMENEALKREDEYSTGVGRGVAIPHVRCPHVKEPVIVFGYSKTGIEWNSIDGKPVHFVFLLISPEKAAGIHLEILSKIVTVMQDVNNQKRLAKAALEQYLEKELKNIFWS
ncbi:MAG: cation:proton antiporter [Endomicrobiales bacterium]|nr:cation:proton antiporter [Endomicrobiales bacterium]